jgi:mono/diheme cytochrome c family protein
MYLLKIIQYIKTFAPKKWEKKKKSGEMVKTLAPFELPEDPWAKDVPGAVTRGRDLYHFKAECVNCHPAYGGKEELYKLSVEASKREPAVFSPLTGFRDDVYGSAAKDSDEYKVRILPPDFTFSKVRSVHKGTEMEDLFRVISYGVYPIMPAWKDALTDKDIWAISHYVKSLMDITDKPEAAAMKARFSSQAPFEIPVAKPEEKPAEPAAEGEKKEGDAKPDEKKAGDVKPEDKKDNPADQKGPAKDEKKAPEKK